MKNLVLLLLSAGSLAWSLAGCATSAADAPATSHVLRTTSPLALDLPAWTDEQAAPALAERSITSPVAGLPAHSILQMLGRPAERPRSDLWIYWGYYSPEDAAATGGCDTLVVAFVRGRVNAMKLVNGEALRTHLTRRGVTLASKPL